MLGYNNEIMYLITDFEQANKVLMSFVPDNSEIKHYTLDRMRKFMAFIGNPQNNLKVIHIAGTSGKTSTAYFVASLLESAGHRTGLTVSPHIDKINERAQIGLKGLTEPEYCRELSEFLEIATESGIALSYFEVMVAFAYWLFDKRRVEYGVVEVGLGGLLDGTNVVNRTDKVCVIADIGMDHTNVLGNTISEIAHQKGGIITEGNHVFMNSQDNVVKDVVRGTCQAKNANLVVIKPRSDKLLSELPLFQRRNFALANRVASYVLERDYGQVITSKIKDKALTVYIPGRMEVVKYMGKELILDGSHNEQKIGALVESVKSRYPDQRIPALVSFGKLKESTVQANLQLIKTISNDIILTQFKKGQDEVRLPIDADRLADYAKQAGFKSISIERDPIIALAKLMKEDASVCLVTGSLYLLSDLHAVVTSTTKQM